jgi:hypothetical protein
MAHKDDFYKLVPVMVQWLDAFDGPNGWIENLDEYQPGPCLPVTVGYLWPQILDGYITLVSTYHWDEDEEEIIAVSCPTHIPVGMVKKIKVINAHALQDVEINSIMGSATSVKEPYSE